MAFYKWHIILTMNTNTIIKTENIIRISPEDSLSSALSKLSSSHDAAFVFENSGHYVGVINPYYTVIKSSLPGNTKVEHCVFHPPRVFVNDTLERIAQQMTESKIHYLPVFNDNHEFIGITSGRRILREIQKLPIAKTSVTEVYESRNGGVISVYDNDTINTALQLFKEHKISKLVVIDKNMKLQGILSYYDLVPYLIADGQGEKRRSLKSKEKEHLMSMKVKGYAKKTMLTVHPSTTVFEAINEMITRGMGSVIIVDNESNPVGIVTTKDIFNLLKSDSVKKSIELTEKNVSPKNEDVVTEFTNYVSHHIQQLDSIKSARVLVHEEKNGILFRIAVYLTPAKGKEIVISKEGKDLLDMIKETKQALQSKLVDK